jgi:CRISPR-associated exonuclease Cas4
MRCGLAKERRLQQLQKRRSCRDFGFPPGTASLQANVPLMSTNLHLSGRLDLLLVRGNQRFPVEVKFSHGPARLNHRLQLAGYALLLEDLFGIPVPHGYIVRLPDETIDRVPIDQPLRDLALQTMQALRHMLLSEQMPPASPILARCADCEYRRFCGDVL